MKTAKDIEEKFLLVLDKERQQLWRTRYQMVGLETPIQRGWKRCYFLTAEAELRADRDLLEAILRVINVTRRHWRRCFTPTKRKRKQQQMQEMFHELGRIRLADWQSPRFPDEFRKYFFVEPLFIHTTWVPTFRFRWPNLFELRTVPHMVYEVPLLDPVTESRCAEIEQLLDRRGRRFRLNRLKNMIVDNGPDPRDRMLERLAAKRLRAVLAGDVEAEKRARSAMRVFFSAPTFACVVQ